MGKKAEYQNNLPRDIFGETMILYLEPNSIGFSIDRAFHDRRFCEDIFPIVKLWFETKKKEQNNKQ